MPEKLSEKDTTWLARFVEGIVREQVPTALVNATVEELTVTELLTLSDQMQAARPSLDYINKNISETAATAGQRLTWDAAKGLWVPGP